jgi:hypothetical protein
MLSGVNDDSRASSTSRIGVSVGRVAVADIVASAVPCFRSKT